jgi:SOS response regulatory protein OraA/RecX
LGERNAANEALSYLRSSSFSREGLIKQLEYEGFSHQEAVYGVDQSGADWNEQAALEAAAYLKSSSFSRSGLIDQLEYEGFTPQQAEYGVRAVGY